MLQPIMSAMLEASFFLLCTLVLPVLINKSTEGEQFAWVKPWLRELWTLVFVFFSVYFLSEPQGRSIFMKAHSSLHGVWGYLICAILGAAALCLYWWFTGKITPQSAIVAPIHSAVNTPAGQTRT